MATLFHGPVSEVITPFTSKGEVDYSLLGSEIRFMIERGITGFFVNGLASESLMLSREECNGTAKAVVGTVKGKVPVMGNIIQNSISGGIKRAEEYAEMGMDAIIITPPLIYKYSEDGLYEFFTEIAKSVKIPAYIYNAPETGNKLSPSLVSKIFLKNENFRGYKDSTQSIIDQQTLLRLLDGRPIELMAGSDAQIMTTMMLGGVGVISLISTVFPKLIVDICAACDRKDWEKAKQLQFKIIRVREALKIGPFMAAYKYVGTQVGNPMGTMREPLKSLSEENKASIDKILKEQEMI